MKLKRARITQLQKKSKALRQEQRRISQRQTQDKMRGGLDVAAAGAWHRANPRKRMPQYLQWLQLKFIHMALKLAKNDITSYSQRSLFMTNWIREQLTENKRQWDYLRRRLLLDRVIGINWKICQSHNQIYFPLCRTRKSEYYWHRHCTDCYWENQDRMQ